MENLKKSTQKSLAIAIISIIVILILVLISSPITFKGFCANGQSCHLFEYTIQRLIFSLAASWKVIIIIAAFPYLLQAVRHFKLKIKKNNQNT